MVTEAQGIGRLAEALAKAQAAFPAITKDKVAKVESRREGARSYTYTYADLANVLDATRKGLTDNGLAVVQIIEGRDGGLVLVTRLIHVSGESIESAYPLAVFQAPQEQGSAITYARRYSLTALLGIAAEEDDDGGAAQKAAKADDGIAVPAFVPSAAPRGTGMVSDAQIKRLWAIARGKAWTEQTVHELLTRYGCGDEAGVVSTKAIPLTKYDAIIEQLKAGPEMLGA